MAAADALAAVCKGNLANQSAVELSATLPYVFTLAHKLLRSPMPFSALRFLAAACSNGHAGNQSAIPQVWIPIRSPRGLEEQESLTTRGWILLAHAACA